MGNSIQFSTPLEELQDDKDIPYIWSSHFFNYFTTVQNLHLLETGDLKIAASFLRTYSMLYTTIITSDQIRLAGFFLKNELKNLLTRGESGMSVCIMSSNFLSFCFQLPPHLILSASLSLKEVVACLIIQGPISSVCVCVGGNCCNHVSF